MNERSKAGAELGKATSERKAASSRENGKKGGRPNRLLTIARLMHGLLCDCDDKRCELTNDIYLWLYNGDTPEAYTVADVPAMVKEWKEYAGQSEE